MSFGGGFLRYPDLFPGRHGGEVWGGRSVALDIPGGPYLLRGLSETQEEAVRRRFGSLCRQAGGEGIPSAVFRAPGHDFLEIDTRGWEYNLEMDHAPGVVRLAGLRLMALLDWTPSLTGGLWTPEEMGEEFSSVCENFLRVLTAYRLLEQGGAVLHSAGVTDGRAAFLLLGRSGAGKTTSSHLCLEAGATVLSDDLNAVRGGSVVKLPFTGDLGERSGGPAEVPLRAFCKLVQGPEDRLRPLTPAMALASLVAAAPFVNRDPWRRETLLETLEALARAIPAYELTFTLGADVWGILNSIPP